MQSATRSKIENIKAKCNPLLEGHGEYKRNLGNGSFGTVNHIICKENFAIKIIHLQKFIKDLKSEKELLEHLSSAFSEFQIMKKNIPNVVRSYQCHFDEDAKIFSFTMDLMKGGDLATLIKNGEIPFEKFYNIFRDVFTGRVNPKVYSFVLFSR